MSPLDRRTPDRAYWRSLDELADSPEFRKFVENEFPASVGRLAEPEEIAGPIAFLLSPAASYICGAILDVNGGVYMN